MNINEVLANLASTRAGTDVHPNDHVNMSQSSNDVIPTAIHMSAAMAVSQELLPAVQQLISSIEQFADRHADVVKTGRTHLMDAMPVTIKQECSAWITQLEQNAARIHDTQPRLQSLALGGTAVGTGINTPENFAARAIKALSDRTGLTFTEMDNRFAGIASQDTAVELSSHLNTLAVTLTKIANDLRWMNSGPVSGLQEAQLPALQPGSSIMPGKVNPVIPEAVLMASAQVIGNHSTITVAGMSGNFQLNVMLPVIAHNLLESLSLMTASCCSLAEMAFEGLIINTDHLGEQIARNPILITALNQTIGYEKGAVIAKRAYQEGRPLLEIAIEETGMDEKTLRDLLDPSKLT